MHRSAVRADRTRASRCPYAETRAIQASPAFRTLPLAFLLCVLSLGVAACDRPEDVVGPPGFQIMGDLPTAVDHMTFDRLNGVLYVDVCVSRGIIEAAQQGGVPFSVMIRVTLADLAGHAVTLDPPAYPLALFKPTGPAIEAVYAGTLSLPWDGMFAGGVPYTSGALSASYAGKVVRELSNGREVVIGSETTGQLTVTVVEDRIAFVSTRDGSLGEIYVMNADGTSQTRLTKNGVADENPLWSPDKSRILFRRYDGIDDEVWVMDDDGNNPINLSLNAGRLDAGAVWSPDGTKIAFHSVRGNYPTGDIYVVNSDGSGGLVNLTNHPAADRFPHWSPDGTRIAFESNRDGDDEIYVMNADGTNLVQLTNNSAQDELPRWSADGSRIAFQSDRDGNPEVYVMLADGTSQTNVSNSPADDASFQWAPGGNRLIFHSYRDGNYEVYGVSAIGLVPVNLTNDPGFDFTPVYSPDGSRIAFTSNRTGTTQQDILVMNADGSGVVILTSATIFDDVAPAWR